MTTMVERNSPLLGLKIVLVVVLFSTFISLVKCENMTTSRRLMPNYGGDDGRRRMVQVKLAKYADEHLVKSLPLLENGHLESTEMYAGLLPADSSKKDKFLFYWMFTPDKEATSKFAGDEDDIPLIIWLNGGPGCSSMDGLFIEHGPLQFKQDGNGWKLEPREFSWHKVPAYTLYLDQPVGTGLSFTTSGKYPGNDKEINKDFYFWLEEFLTLHADTFLNEDKTELRRPLYFTGESHAGHYIPNMITYILKQNESSNKKYNIPVTGAAIGNGWVDPYNQYAVAEAALGYGIIDHAQKAHFDELEAECQNTLNRGRYQSSGCFKLLDDIVGQSQGSNSHYKVSQYDIRNVERKRSDRYFPPGHKIIEGYLGKHRDSVTPSVQSDFHQVLKALHATASTEAGQFYQECTDPPYNALSHQDGLGVIPQVIKSLDQGVKMLFFNGVYDLICNHLGNEKFLEKMEWEHRDEWIGSKRFAWNGPLPEGQVAGYVKEVHNLMFLKVMNAGHMVPLDVPLVALDMMKNFITGNSFEQSFQDLKRDIPSEERECPECPSCKADIDAAVAEIENDNENMPLLEFVVAHSWVGAVLVVAVFVCVYISRRRSSSSPFEEVEMKNRFADGPMRYRDRYDDDDEDDDDEP